MPIPSIRAIGLFILLNICLVTFFDIILFNYDIFITYEINNSFFIADEFKIIKLVTVFTLTVFILNALIFKFLLKTSNRPIFTALKVSVGVVIIGIIFTAVIELLK